MNFTSTKCNPDDEIHMLKQSGFKSDSKIHIENISPNDDNDPESLMAPASLASWQTISTIIIADVIGSAILALGSAMAEVGWALGLLMLCAFLPMNIYIGLILAKLKLVFPGAYTSLKLSEIAIDRKWFSWLHYIFFYSALVGYCGIFLQTFTVALWAVFVNFQTIEMMCFWQWQAIGCAILLIFMQVRSFHQGRWLYALNAATIAIVVFIAAGYMLAHMNDPIDSTDPVPRSASVWIADGMTWRMFVSSMSMICTAYSGSPLFMELMAEMKRPADFPKTFWIAGPYEFFFYLLSSVTQYAYQGADAYGKITDALPKGSAIQITANVFLAIHMVVTFMCRGQIMSREFHMKLFPSTVCDYSMRGRVHWTICTGILLALCFLISNVIPNFTTLLSLMGALQAPYLGFVIPAIIFYVARDRLEAHGIRIFKGDWVALLFICLISFFLIILGTINVFIDVVDSFSSATPPFSCITLSQLIVLK